MVSLFLISPEINLDEESFEYTYGLLEDDERAIRVYLYFYLPMRSSRIMSIKGVRQNSLTEEEIEALVEALFKQVEPAELDAVYLPFKNRLNRK